MNHLAHCFLSFGDEELLIGNFIADFVKGSAWKMYPAGIQRGIHLHRRIDSFTDAHPAVWASKQRLRPFSGRYSGPVTDILYDHLLAVHWQQYTAEDFNSFVLKTYAALEKGVGHMPAMLQERLPRMLAGDFLSGYSVREGMDFVLDRFSRRLPQSFDRLAVLNFFWENLDTFSGDFQVFFPELQALSRDEFQFA